MLPLHHREALRRGKEAGPITGADKKTADARLHARRPSVFRYLDLNQD